MLLMVGVLVLFLLSLRERIQRTELLRAGEKDLPMEPRPSPLATALSELLAMAGGIYVTLLVGVSFLELNIPAKMTLGTVSLEPLAGISLFLAIIQPLLRRLWPGWK